MKRADLTPVGSRNNGKDYSSVYFPPLLTDFWKRSKTSQRFWIIDRGTQMPCIVVEGQEYMLLYFDIDYPIRVHWSDLSDMGQRQMHELLREWNGKNMRIGWAGLRETIALAYVLATGVLDIAGEDRQEIVSIDVQDVAEKMIERDEKNSRVEFMLN